jgi:lipopolysaccharide export LptBFGC system permease protein LptF
MTLRELAQEISNLGGMAVDTARLRTEYWRKISWSFSPFVFVLLGFPLAVITHRREKSANVVIAVLCAAFYYLISLGCEALGIKNIVNPAFIMWVPNLIAVSTAIYLNIKCVS